MFPLVPCLLVNNYQCVFLSLCACLPSAVCSPGAVCGCHHGRQADREEKERERERKREREREREGGRWGECVRKCIYIQFYEVSWLYGRMKERESESEWEREWKWNIACWGVLDLFVWGQLYNSWWWKYRPWDPTVTERVCGVVLVMCFLHTWEREREREREAM